jgi:hypothetical protein
MTPASERTCQTATIKTGLIQRRSQPSREAADLFAGGRTSAGAGVPETCAEARALMVMTLTKKAY